MVQAKVRLHFDDCIEVLEHIYDKQMYYICHISDLLLQHIPDTRQLDMDQ